MNPSDFDKTFSQMQKQTGRVFGLALIGSLIGLGFGLTLLVAAIWALGHFAFHAW